MEYHATPIHRAHDPKDQDRWMVSIDGFVTQYSKGTGLREGYKLPWGGRYTIHDLEQFRDPRKSWTVDPTVEEVLESLAMDASCYLNARDIDEFAAEFGYDGKVSECIKAWEGCRDAAKFFQSRGLNWEDYTEEARESRKTA